MDRNGNGYDIYDLYDLGEFEQKGARRTKFGSREELQELVDEARRLGVGIIWDAVLNHKAGADRVESCRAVKVNPERMFIFYYDSLDSTCLQGAICDIEC